MLLALFRKNTLPLAMIAGTLGYFLFAKVEMLHPMKPMVFGVVSFLTPLLIFAQLLLTFCKIEPAQLKPRWWHLYWLLFQLVGCLLMAAILYYMPIHDNYRDVLEAAMVCLICPTATAAAVITAKLGGSASGITTYTLLSNILAAIVVPIVFPLVEPHASLSFFEAFIKILSKVFPLLLFPFFIAMAMRWCWKTPYRWLANHSGMAFYLWALALTFVSGMTVRSLVNSPVSASIKWLIALVALIACLLQFFVGKKWGKRMSYCDTITGGQALGQKNTVLAIWMAYTYLTPLSSIGPGAYVLWQNSINSWQLWKQNKKQKK